ncbi:nickel-dependent lactate racemase [Alkaliphilus peptidifermentans]|uniref:Nickel-dependent lactate racemase n=1 Tax=Alkaliphilus peptidifermentans DSM 18978 TaxID=1120976 RepID=A0A1G5K962_9FIRM|nr:nickel-dependent lactate racemase [Alkaliphilus peptidifermentans]SCY97067.1 Nickel-dependent lactate racemase [Alkaliphilus peptidifermentans DSM 18978]
MSVIKIPYLKGFIDLEIPDMNLKGILESRAHHFHANDDEVTIVRKALENPIESSRLSELAKGKKNIVIITSDHTRPVPSKITLPILLEEIRCGSPDAEITILIATGFHRSTTYEEMTKKFGEEIVNNENLINHVCGNDSSLVKVGILPSGGELWLNRLAIGADLLVSEGFIEPHFFAGFSGGRKSVLPGVAGKTTVLANHCSKFIHDDNSRTGILEGNPIHKDMLFAAEAANLAFILNVVIDADKKIINAFAGHPVKAHADGCDFVTELASVNAVYSDIVITSNGGYPLDQNIYQSVKGMTAAEASAKEDAVIIIAAACNDGHGGEAFYQTFLENKTAHDIMDKIMGIPMESTIPDQWESQILARILIKHKVILVTDECDPKLVTDMHMLHAYTLDEALKMAYEMKGKDASITVIPDGVAVIVKK